MKPDILLLIKACQAGLHIAIPVEIRIKTKSPRDTEGMAGWYETRYRKNKPVRHVVFINLETVIESQFDIYGVIAHELIHASMLEHGLFNEDYHHDKTFQELATHLENYLSDMGFNTGALYSAETDTE